MLRNANRDLFEAERIGLEFSHERSERGTFSYNRDSVDDSLRDFLEKMACKTEPFKTSEKRKKL